MSRIFWKFPGRKKAEGFFIYKPDGEWVTIQSDKTIARINLRTGYGLLNAKGQGTKYFMHLNPALGAVKYKFPKELIEMIKKKLPKSGDYIGSSPITGPIYWA